MKYFWLALRIKNMKFVLQLIVKLAGVWGLETKIICPKLVAIFADSLKVS